MLVLLTTLGWNVCGFSGFLVCVFVSWFIFLSKIFYLILVSQWSFSSIVLCMCGHMLFNVLARDMCRWYICKLSLCFLECRNVVSSLIRLLVILCCVYMCAGEVLGTLILAQEVDSFLRHCLLKWIFALHLYRFHFYSSYLWMELRLAFSILRCVIPVVFVQYKEILVYYLSSLTQLYILFISI